MEAQPPNQETRLLVPIYEITEVDHFSAETEHRLEHALDEWQNSRCDTIEVIGHSNDSGQRMANWLKERGVPEDKVRVHPLSRYNTEILDTFNELLKLMRTLGMEAFVRAESKSDR